MSREDVEVSVETSAEPCTELSSPGVVDPAWAQCREAGGRAVERAGRYDPVHDQPIGWLDVE